MNNNDIYGITRTLAAIVNNVAIANVFAACEGHIRCRPSEIATVSIDCFGLRGIITE